MHPNHANAWQDGYNARCEGATAKQNPYRANTWMFKDTPNFNSWRQGWECANEHIRAREAEVTNYLARKG